MLAEIREKKLDLLGISLIYIYGLSIMISRAAVNISSVLLVITTLFLEKKRLKKTYKKENYLLILVIFVAFFLSFFTDGGSKSAYHILRKSFRYAPVICFPLFLDDIKKIKNLILMLVISLGINFYKGSQTYIKYIKEGWDLGSLRYQSFTLINESAYMALGISFIFLAMLIYCVLSKKYKMAVLYTFGYIISVLILLLSKTRGAWLGFIVSFLIFIFIFNRKLFLGTVILIALTLTFYLKNTDVSTNKYVQRFISIKNTDNDDSSIIRIILWETGYDIFKDNYLVGVGKYNSGKFYREYIDRSQAYEKLKWKDHSTPFLYSIADQSHPHNMYVDTLVEYGIIVFMLRIFFAIYLSWQALKYVFQNNKNGHLYLIVLGAFVSTLTFYFSGMFEDSLDNSKLVSVYIVSLVIMFSVRFNDNLEIN